MTYDEAIAWLFGLLGFGVKLGVENMRRLVDEVGLEKVAPHILHVAGTNGKGSTCAFAESICREAGLKTGLYTSPHLVRFNERIRVGGADIADEAFADCAARVRAICGEWDPHPTFFEVALAIGLLHFQDEGADVVVLETGMGGRLDATNAVPGTTASAIRPIGLDHVSQLGPDLASIAGEKAGILKPGVPAHLGSGAEQPPEALAVLRARAAELDAPEVETPALPPELSLGIPGPHQRDNAAAALALVRASGIEVAPSQVAAGISGARWPARFQRLPHPSGEGDLIIDGAHNPSAARALAATWRERFGEWEGAHVLFGAATGKDAAEVLRLLAPVAASFTFVDFQSPRAVSAEKLAALAADAVPGVPFTTAPDVATALAEAEAPTLLCGSLFFAGEALAHLGGLTTSLQSIPQ